MRANGLAYPLFFECTNIPRDIDAAYDHLTKNLGVNHEKIILYGQSIGTSPSTDKASRLGRASLPLAGLILHSPMSSGIRILRPQCSPNFCINCIDPFQNINKIQHVKAPTLILHGCRDNVIPFEHSEKLHQLCANPVEPLFLSRATHDDVESFPQYIPRLKKFLDEADKFSEWSVG